MNPDAQDTILAIDLYIAFANGSYGEREREQISQLAREKVFPGASFAGVARCSAY